MNQNKLSDSLAYYRGRIFIAWCLADNKNSANVATSVLQEIDDAIELAKNEGDWSKATGAIEKAKSILDRQGQED